MNKSSHLDFEDLKRRADFGLVLAHYGIKPSKQGDQTKIPCPFHDDENPSCSVNLGKGVFNCFGCHASGNVLDFVFRMENRDGAATTLRQAGITLARICGLESGDRKAAPSGREGRREAKDGQPTRTIQRPAARPAGSQRGTEAAPEPAELKPNKPLGFALTLDPDHPYLRERGIAPELVETFGLGYCEKGSMAGRVCIPIHNADGRVVAYAGRWAGKPEELPEGEDKYKLPAGFHKSLELWNLHRVKSYRHLVIAEGFFGTIRLHGERIPAVGLMGNSISEQQIALLLAHCPNLRFVTVMLDGDEPGREAAEKVVARLARHWWVRLALLPEGEQPDSASLSTVNALLRRTQLEAA